MNIADFLSVLLRRWYVILIVLALTAVGGLQYVSTIKPTYATGGTYLLTPAVRSVELQEDFTVAAVSRILNPALRPETLTETGADYVTNPVAGTPIMTLTVTDPSSAVVTESIDLLLQRVDDVVRGLADGDPVRSRAAEVRVLSRSVVRAVGVEEGGNGNFRGDVSLVIVARGGEGETIALGPNSGTGRILIEAIRGRAAEGEGENFGLTINTRDGAPLVYSNAVSPDPERVLTVHEEGIEFTRTTLSRLGGDSSPQLVEIRPPLNISERGGDLMRPLVALTALGVGLALLLAFLLESLMAQRALRRGQGAGDPAVASEPSGKSGRKPATGDKAPSKDADDKASSGAGTPTSSGGGSDRQRGRGKRS